MKDKLMKLFSGSHPNYSDPSYRERLFEDYARRIAQGQHKTNGKKAEVATTRLKPANVVRLRREAAKPHMG